MQLKIRHWENIHIPLWLLKDTCWMLEWRTLGIVMIVPTVSVAIYLALKTWKEEEFFINLAICFWISANAYWMCCEFAHHPELKNMAGFPFVIGMLCVAIFYARRLRKKDPTISE